MRMSENRILRIVYESKRKRRSDWWIDKIKSSFVLLCVTLVFLQRNSPTRAQAALLLRFLDHTHTHTHTHTRQVYSGRLINSSQRPLPTQKVETSINALTGIRNSIPSNQTAAHQRLRSHGHGDRRQIFFFTLARQPQWAKTSLSRIHDHPYAHHTWQDSSGRVISPTQRPLPDNTQH